MASSTTSAERSSSVPRAPGSMTAVMQAYGARPATHLRVGVVEDGRLVHDVIVAPGTGPDAELGAPVVHRDGRFWLRVPPNGEGRLVGASGAPVELRSGVEQLVALEEGTRGRLRVGARTFLFQLVEAPPARTIPRLPVSVRQNLFEQIDRGFTAMVMASFMAHFGFVTFLESADWPAPAGIAAIPTEAIEMLVTPMEPEPVAPIEDPSADVPPEEVADATPTEPGPTAPSDRADRPSRDSAPSEADRERIVATAIASVDHMLLGVLGGEDGALTDVLAGGMAVGPAADILATAESVGIASGPPTLSDRTGGHVIADRFPPARLEHVGSGTGPVDEGAPIEETGPHPIISTCETTHRCDEILDPVGPGEFDTELLLRALRRVTPRIRRCYERALNDDPTLAGRVEVSLTLIESGSVTGVRATENTTNSDSVASCVVDSIRTIRVMPGPSGGSVTYSFPFLFSTNE